MSFAIAAHWAASKFWRVELVTSALWAQVRTHWYTVWVIAAVSAALALGLFVVRGLRREQALWETRNLDKPVNARATREASERPRAGRHPHWGLGVVCLAGALTTIDAMVMNNAMKAMGDVMRLTAGDGVWMLNAYTIAFTSFIIVATRLADRYGRLRMLAIGNTAFAVISGLLELCDSAPQVIVARFLLGVGGALLYPSTLALIPALFEEKQQRGNAIAVWSSMNSVGLALGPPIAGALLQHFWWGSVFSVNFPIVGLALLGVACRVLPESKEVGRKPLGVVPLVLSTLGLTLLVWGMVAMAYGVDLWVWMRLGVGLGLFVAFIVHQLVTSHPVLVVRLFKVPQIAAGAAAIGITYFAIAGTVPQLVQYLQLVLGKDAMETGWVLLRVALALGFGAALGRKVVTKHVGARWTVVIGLLLGTAMLWLWAWRLRDMSFWEFQTVLCAAAAGAGLIQPATTEIVMNAAASAGPGQGAGINELTRGTLMVKGATVGTLMTTIAMRVRLAPWVGLTGLTGVAAADARTHLASAALAAERGVPHGAELLSHAQDAFTTGFACWLVVAGGALGLMAFVLCVFPLLPGRERSTAASVA